MKIAISTVEVLLTTPLLALFFFSLIPITQRIFRRKEEQSSLISMGWGIIGILSAAAFLNLSSGIKQLAFYKAIVSDGVSVAASVIIFVLAIASLFLLQENISTKTERFSEKVFLILTSVIGMVISVCANDLIVMFIGIEIMSISLYILITLAKEDTLSKEASFKYFLMGSFASAIFLMGMAYVFGIGRTTIISDLVISAPDLIFMNKIFYVGILLLILGLCFKVAIFPFHYWTPDVYQGSPTPVTAFMASAVKVASFVAMYRVLAIVAGVEGITKLVNFLQWLAVLSMLVGNVSALLQDNLKRMLAYSSIAHSGYIMVGLISFVNAADGTRAATAFMFYIFSYALMTVGSFGIIGILESHEEKSVTIEDIKGLSSRHPAMAIVFTVLLLSLAGLPPMLGFFGKLYIFTAAIEQGLYWLTFWGVLNSAIAAYYYLRPIVYMYMVEGRAITLPKQRFTKIILAISAAVVLVFGIGVQSVYKEVEKKVRSIVELP